MAMPGPAGGLEGTDSVLVVLVAGRHVQPVDDVSHVESYVSR